MSEHATAAASRAISSLKERVTYLPVSGHYEPFAESGITLAARSGATTTDFTCPPFTTMPVGLCWTLDNSNGSGNMTMTPITGTPLVANAGEVWYCEVNCAGAVFATARTAAPTS